MIGRLFSFFVIDPCAALNLRASADTTPDTAPAARAESTTPNYCIGYDAKSLGRPSRWHSKVEARRDLATASA